MPRTTHASSRKSLYAFAGIDGAGKTTLVNHVAAKLRASGHDVSISKAYTGEHKAAVGPLLENADPVEIMFYFQAFFRGQIKRTQASLKEGNIVLADRWSEANQAFRWQHDMPSKYPGLEELFGNITDENLEPKYTFYLYVKPETAMRRAQQRGAEYFDASPLSYHQLLEKFYKQKAKANNWITVNAEKSSVEELAQQILPIILGS